MVRITRAGRRGSNWAVRRSRIRSSTVAVAAVAALAATLIMPVAAPVAKNIVQDVLVTNGPDNPVPVAGTVALDPSANGVQVANSAPLDVSSTDAGELVQASRPLIMVPGETLRREVLINVPAGKRFIAERVSGEMVVTDEGWIRVRFGGVGGIEWGVETSPVTGRDPGRERAVYNDEVDFFVDGPDQVQATILRSDPNMASNVAQPASIVGRFVECASCQ